MDACDRRIIFEASQPFGRPLVGWARDRNSFEVKLVVREGGRSFLRACNFALELEALATPFGWPPCGILRNQMGRLANSLIFACIGRAGCKTRYW